MTRAARHDLVVVACAASAGVHAGLVPAHLDEHAALAAAFAAAAAALGACAVAASRRPRSPAAVAAAGTVLAACVVAYLLVGVGAEPVSALAATTKLVELAGAASAWSLLSRREARLA